MASPAGGLGVFGGNLAPWDRQGAGTPGAVPTPPVVGLPSATKPFRTRVREVGMGNRGRRTTRAVVIVCLLALTACRQRGEQPGEGIAGQVEEAQKKAQEAFRQAQEGQQQGSP